ncbi:Uu.00g038830.m01.CDS01 [Anthostomella pinea]|uniref:Uu.00g038830.m01.CDS01 n=1 Tax=Anthostomella pinea TaxID=933095 RepID=A0AAI8YDS0_9PEZI|nr:Uu.00g038830.m01.CDS01 [Anthostomella pinea]
MPSLTTTCATTATFSPAHATQTLSAEAKEGPTTVSPYYAEIEAFLFGDFDDEALGGAVGSTPLIDEMDIEMDLDLDVDREAPATEQAADIIANTDDAAYAEATVAPTEDVMVEYMGTAWPCNSAILRRECGSLRTSLESMDLTLSESGELPWIILDRFSECDSPEVFYSVLDAMYTDHWTCSQTWELESSYLTSVKLYLIGMHWDILALRQIALNDIFALTSKLNEKNNKNKTEQRKNRDMHLMSFVRAVRLALKHDWHAKLWRELYQSGEDLKAKLVVHPGFMRWVKSEQAGKDYARAIGVKKL